VRFGRPCPNGKGSGITAHAHIARDLGRRCHLLGADCRQAESGVNHLAQPARRRSTQHLSQPTQRISQPTQRLVCHCHGRPCRKGGQMVGIQKLGAAGTSSGLEEKRLASRFLAFPVFLRCTPGAGALQNTSFTYTSFT
jgi:hypothetical protein